MKPVYWLAVLLLAGLLVWGYGCEQKRQGALKAEIAELKRQGKAIDTLYVTQTKTLTKVRRITDSVITTDTVFRDTTVRRLILGERAACDAVISTCEAKVANQQAQIDKLLKQRPGLFAKVGDKLIWVGAGVVLGKILLK